MGILMTVLGIFGAIVLSLVNDEIKSWLPNLTQRIVDRAVLRHPPEQQEHHAMLWQAHLSEYPGKLSQLYQALKLSSASKNIVIQDRPKVLTNTYLMVIFTQISTIFSLYLDLKTYGLKAISKFNAFMMAVALILALVVIIKYIGILVQERRERELKRIADLPVQQ